MDFPIPTEVENSHLTLEEFGKGLQSAASVLFPNSDSQYSAVEVLFVYWDPAIADDRLPVLLEINELDSLLSRNFGFRTDRFPIPAAESHKLLRRRIDAFVELGGDSPGHLKILYYAGHGSLGETRQAVWGNIANERSPDYRYVKWGSIQTDLEEAHSDVLLLLDCCSSGTSNTHTGNGVTELMAATTFRHSANGVGDHSFTRALIDELYILWEAVVSGALTRFTTGLLYNNVLRRLQMWLPRPIERQYSPVHVVLTQNQDLPRSIQLQPIRRVPQDPRALEEAGVVVLSPDSTGSSISSRASQGASTVPSDPFAEVPLLRVELWLSEDLKARQLSVDLWKEWLKLVPGLVKKVKVEATFTVGSSLLIITLPPALLAYLPACPAIVPREFVRSNNLLLSPVSRRQRARQTASEGSVEAPEGARTPVVRPPPTPPTEESLKAKIAFLRMHTSRAVRQSRKLAILMEDLMVEVERKKATLVEKAKLVEYLEAYFCRLHGMARFTEVFLEEAYSRSSPLVTEKLRKQATGTGGEVQPRAST